MLVLSIRLSSSRFQQRQKLISFASSQEALPMQEPSIYLQRVRWALSALTVLLALMMTGTGLRAQSTQGSILGSVKDSAGAVVPGATVTLTNSDAGIVRTTTTSGSGDYQFLDTVAAA